MGRKKHTNGERYLMLDLGNQFAAGKLIRTNSYMVTLEGYRGKRSYSRDSIQQMIPISRKTAEVLGPFSYPPF